MFLHLRNREVLKGFNFLSFTSFDVSGASEALFGTSGLIHLRVQKHELIKIFN